MLNGIIVDGVLYELKESDEGIRDCRNCGIKELCCSCFATCLAVKIGRTGLNDKRYFNFEKKDVEVDCRKELKEIFIELIYTLMYDGLIDVGNIEKVKEKIIEL